METYGFLFPALLNQTSPPPDSDFFSVRSLTLQYDKILENHNHTFLLWSCVACSITRDGHDGAFAASAHHKHTPSADQYWLMQPMLNTSAANGGMPEFNESYIYNIMLYVLRHTMVIWQRMRPEARLDLSSH